MMPTHSIGFLADVPCDVACPRCRTSLLTKGRLRQSLALPDTYHVFGMVSCTACGRASVFDTPIISAYRPVIVPALHVI